MSGSIRTALGTTRRYAKQHLERYDKLEVQHPGAWDLVTKSSFKTTLDVLKNDLAKFQKHFNKWKQVVVETVDEIERAAEQDRLDAAMDCEENYDLIDALENAIFTINNRMEVPVPVQVQTPIALMVPGPVQAQTSNASSPQVTVPLQGHTSHSPQVTVPVQGHTSHSPQVTVPVLGQTSQSSGMVAYGTAPSPPARIPALDIPKFSGDYLKWSSFWERFDHAIHQQPFPEVEKLISLLGLLEGRALEEVEGFQVTGGNYNTVVKVLVDRFGNKQLILKELQMRLRSIKAADGSVENLRSTVNAINNICLQLKNNGVDINNDSLK
uniref:Uncharacterized protein n=1 Tax=Panagrolaimus superbus TaxID=310955 RepID=A0A914YUR3_9BILA